MAKEHKDTAQQHDSDMAKEHKDTAQQHDSDSDSESYIMRQFKVLSEEEKAMRDAEYQRRMNAAYAAPPDLTHMNAGDSNLHHQVIAALANAMSEPIESDPGTNNYCPDCIGWLEIGVFAFIVGLGLVIHNDT